MAPNCTLTANICYLNSQKHKEDRLENHLHFIDLISNHNMVRWAFLLVHLRIMFSYHAKFIIWNWLLAFTDLNFGQVNFLLFGFDRAFLWYVRCSLWSWPLLPDRMGAWKQTKISNIKRVAELWKSWHQNFIIMLFYAYP